MKKQINISIFCYVISHSHVYRHQPNGFIFNVDEVLHLLWRWHQQVPLKRWCQHHMGLWFQYSLLLYCYVMKLNGCMQN